MCVYLEYVFNDNYLNDILIEIVVMSYADRK